MSGFHEILCEKKCRNNQEVHELNRMILSFRKFLLSAWTFNGAIWNSVNVI